MARIHVLDEHIANQIAAGEVVERPASVVKELVENAIDAGATRIEVVIEEGGLQSIRVKDNGSGIEPEDCETAFYRHATSKITSGRDLFQITSLGFRGEALPSIAAVSKVTLLTACRDDGKGRRLVIEGGRLIQNEDAPAPKGTDLTVGEIFYNTPARLKYMKSIQTELGHISDVMYRTALAHPDIAITLQHNGNPLLRTLGNGDLLQVIAAVYGTSAAKAMLPVSAEDPDYRIDGYISRPEWTRSNRNAVTTIVGGRHIRSHGLNQAILRAYHTLLPINRYPLIVLNLQMHPSLVDVNVHPSKMEVRFSKEPELYALVEREIRRALMGETLIPRPGKAYIAGKEAGSFIQEQFAFPKSTPPDEAGRPAGNGGGQADPYRGQASGGQFPGAQLTAGQLPAGQSPAGQLSASRQTPAGQTPAGQPSGSGQPGAHVQGSGLPGSGAPEMPQAAAQAGLSAAAAASAGSSPLPSRSGPDAAGARGSTGGGNPAAGGWGSAAGDARPEQRYAAGSAPAQRPGGYRENGVREAAAPYRSPDAPARALPPGLGERLWAPPEGAEPSLPAFPELNYIGQHHGTYIIAQNDEGLYLIDQHAAHERINYEYYYEKFGKPADVSQELLLPITLEFTPSESRQLTERLHWFEQAGVYLEHFGGQTFLVRSHPYWFPKGDEKEIIEEMAEWVLSERQIDLAKLREKSSILCSCKASIKANQKLTEQEVDKLLSRLAACKQPYTCPHGRPILISFSAYDLEKLFKRVM